MHKISHLKKQRQQLLHGITQLEQFVQLTRWKRAVKYPKRYIISNWIRRIWQQFFPQPVLITAQTVFGFPLTVPLPSGNDIYVAGGKTHPSEVLFAQYCIQHISEGQTIIDIGAHIGYFTNLFSTLVGKSGKVVAIEPSPESFSVLKKNCVGKSRIILKHAAVSDHDGQLPFFIFPTFYSEYNSFQIDRYTNESWFQQHPPKIVNVPTVSLINYCKRQNIQADWIKIDVEGVEFQILSSIESLLVNTKPSCFVEIVYPKSKTEENQIHQIESLFKKLNYSTFVIQSEGNTQPITDILAYMKQFQLDSENIVCIPN